MEVAGGLPRDVLLEIFSRLPKKARLRCEAVSKNWQNLIGKTASFSTAGAVDSGFVKVYYGLTEQVNFYRFDDQGSIHLQDSLLIPSHQAIQNIGSCNGFFFFTSRDLIIQRPITKLHYNLYNPVTRHLTTLPPPPISTRDIPFGIGFAPDTETNHYKFLVLYELSKGSHGVGVAIFNSESRKWKTKRPISAQFESILGQLCLGAATVYCEGSFYWLGGSLMCLRVFCMKTETFRQLWLPEAEQTYHGAVWESEGSIHYCQFCEIQGLCVWVLLEENPARSGVNNVSDHTYAWRKIYSVAEATSNSILAQAIRPGPHTNHGQPIRIKKVCGFNEHHQILLLYTTKGLVLYDISAKTMSSVSSPFVSPKDTIHMMHLSFTYNNMELPDINVI